MKWYFSITQETLEDQGFADLIRVAVHSANRHTQLRPHLLFDGVECAFTREMRGLGVTVIFNRISFHDQLAETAARRFPHKTLFMRTARGAFQRLDIANIEREDGFVLYTDCDVMFTGAVDELERYRPAVFMAGPQFRRDGNPPTPTPNGPILLRELNSGVMLINVARLRRDLPAIIDYGCDISNLDIGYDQEFLIQFYRGAWSPMALRFNWKPYWGVDPDARIVHWHGPKVDLCRRLLADPDTHTNSTYRDLFNSNRTAYAQHVETWDAFAASAREAAS